MRNIIDHHLELLRSYDPLSETDHAAIAAHVRRAVDARVGGFASVQTRDTQSVVPAIHMGAMLRRGMLGLWRPAVALTSITVIVASAMTIAEIGQRDAAREARALPRVAASPTVTAAAPVVPGSGNDLSVFGGTVAVVVPEQGSTSVETPAVSVPMRRIVPSTRRNVRSVNPAPGVFTTWGTSVFSKEELLRAQGRVGVFSS